VGPGVGQHEPLPNFRDVGGCRTHDGGRVRTGLLYRSSAPVGPGAAMLDGVGIRAVFDLRSPAERSQSPDVVPEGATYSAMDVMADASPPTAADLDRFMADPALANEILGERGAAEAAEQRFRDFVTTASAREGYGALFRRIARTADRPALVHCSTGKDRTGWAIAALLSLLAVPREHIVADYTESAERLEPLLAPARDACIRRGGTELNIHVLARPIAEALDVYGTADGSLLAERLAQRIVRSQSGSEEQIGRRLGGQAPRCQPSAENRARDTPWHAHATEGSREV
jgi:protein-tyrosine phosphatase